jgi:hypothetical protein
MLHCKHVPEIYRHDYGNITLDTVHRLGHTWQAQHFGNRILFLSSKQDLSPSSSVRGISIIRCEEGGILTSSLQWTHLRRILSPLTSDPVPKSFCTSAIHRTMDNIHYNIRIMNRTLSHTLRESNLHNHEWSLQKEFTFKSKDNLLVFYTKIWPNFCAYGTYCNSEVFQSAVYYVQTCCPQS